MALIDQLPFAGMTVGERIRLMRLYLTWSVDQLAAGWSRSRQYVYRVERDELPPTEPEFEWLERRVLEETARRVGQGESVIRAAQQRGAS